LVRSFAPILFFDLSVSAGLVWLLGTNLKAEKLPIDDDTDDDGGDLDGSDSDANDVLLNPL